MRDYPINWAPGIVIWCAGILGVPLFFALLFCLRGLRAMRWQKEWARRQALVPALATVESHERVTAAGDFLLVLSVELKADAYRTVPERARFRGLARLTDALVDQAEVGELGVRFDPSRPADIVVDSEDPELERRAFLERGTPPWKRLDGAPVTTDGAPR